MIENPFNEKDYEDCDIIIVADFFSKDVTGGAELSTQALIDSVPENLKLMTLYSREINLKLLERYQDKFWVFTNCSMMPLDLIPTIASNLDYSIVEYDYKFCKYRSIEKHYLAEQSECNCHEEIHGKVISAFFLGAKIIWWMSEKQKERYVERFPFIEDCESVVLSSIFDDDFFVKIDELNMLKPEKSGWLVLDSNSWIKGKEEGIKYCEENNLDYELISNLSYSDTLEKLSKAEGLVYLPRGGDTCPRLVIEAQLLGCRIIMNEHVQHKDEIWFNTDDYFDTRAYLYAARDRFWDGIVSKMNWSPTISGYTTIYNGINNEYPWKKCIESMVGFCDEVIVVDGGSNDGTWEELQELSKENKKIKIQQNPIDWDHPRFAYHSDGMQKAYARSLCTSDFCWQMDSDEFVLPKDFKKVINLVKRFPRFTNLIAMPVIEFWGSFEKVRVDVNPWKWRLSRNLEEITHGIPKELRRFDEENNLYTAIGSDTCDYVNKETFERVPFIAYYSEDVEMCRRKALTGDKKSLEDYQIWAQRITENIPTVYHVSWLDMERKVKFYKNFWSKFWQSQYNTTQEDTAENNMFFNKPWAEVSEKEIKDISSKLSKEMGGWIFHQKIDWNAKTPSIEIEHKCKEFLEE